MDKKIGENEDISKPEIPGTEEQGIIAGRSKFRWRWTRESDN